MEKRDILYEIYNKQITSKEASAFFEKLMEIEVPNVLDCMGIDLSTEWTALVLHHMSYEVVAKWRYEGWPNTCVICGEKFDVQKDAWRAFRQLEIEGNVLKNVMTHWDCYTEFRKKLSKKNKKSKRDKKLSAKQ